MGLEVAYTKDRAVPTLSSTVSNFDSKIASISGLKVSVDSSCRALLNLVIWSTASFPTKAYPMKTTKLGLFILTKRASSFISGVLSCILPAVSTNTASMCFLVACVNLKIRLLLPSRQSLLATLCSLFGRQECPSCVHGFLFATLHQLWSCHRLPTWQRASHFWVCKQLWPNLLICPHHLLQRIQLRKVSVFLSI